MERKTKSNLAVMDVIRLIFVNYNQISCDSFEVLIKKILVFTHHAVCANFTHVYLYNMRPVRAVLKFSEK